MLSRRIYPRLSVDERRPIVEYGQLILGSGPATDAVLMERLMERAVSPEMGRWIAAVIGTERATGTELSADPVVAGAQHWLEQRFTLNISIAELASELSTSHQTLIRRFNAALGMGPRDYVQRLRVQAASRMLARTNRNVERIALLVGYRDVRSFRAVFREHTGLSATSYRKAVRDSGTLV